MTYACTRRPELISAATPIRWRIDTRDHGGCIRIATGSRGADVERRAGADVVKIPRGMERIRRRADLKALLANRKILKIFHLRGSISPHFTTRSRDARGRYTAPRSLQRLLPHLYRSATG